LDAVSKALTFVIYDSKPIPGWVVFAAEVLLDLRALIGADFDGAESRLFEIAEGIKKQVQYISKTAETVNTVDRQLSHEVQSSWEWAMDWTLVSTRYSRIRFLHPFEMLSGYHHGMYEAMSKRDKVVTNVNLARLKAQLGGAELFDTTGNPAKHRRYLEDHIGPSIQARFLRYTNPLMCGTLLLQLRIIYEEFGMRFANSYPSICAMGQLFHAETKLGKIKSRWPDMELVITLHMKEIFRGTLPLDTDAMLQRALLTAGTDYKMMAEAKRLEALPTSGQRSYTISTSQLKGKTPWDLFPSPLMLVLRDMYNGSAAFGQVIARLGDLMEQKSYPSSAQPHKSLTCSLSTISFLTELSGYLVAMRDQFKIDYVTLTRTCNALFKQIEEETNEKVYKRQKRPDTAWRVPSMTAYATMMNVISELHAADKAVSTKMMHNPTRFEGTELADIAARRLIKYIEEEGAEGVPGEKKGVALIGFDKGVMPVRARKKSETKADTGARIGPQPK
jgi:hypothetical protein